MVLGYVIVINLTWCAGEFDANVSSHHRVPHIAEDERKGRIYDWPRGESVHCAPKIPLIEEEISSEQDA